MIFFGEYWVYYMLGIILLPGLILATWASARVNMVYNKYKEVLSSKEITGADAVKKILDSEGVYGVQILISDSKENELNNYYNPKNNTIVLAPAVYNGMSISALGIAAHEAGHAIQYAKNYAPVKVRTVLATVTNATSSLLWPMIVIGIILNFAYVGGVVGQILVFCGIVFFGLGVLCSLIELPVEYNASKRALACLVQTGCVDEMEIKGAKKVLNSAALTYVASLVVAILSLLRFVAFILMNSRRD